jgi:hypothetical protein
VTAIYKVTVTFVLLQTRGDGIAQSVRVLRYPIFIIYLDKSNFGELLEIQDNQIRDIEVPLIRRAGSF